MGCQKNINDDDMTTMLALKRKRQTLGKDIRFQYKGHDVEQERLERAYKRQIGSPKIGPCLRTFNVIPNNSEAISCIKHNDLEGLQTLFDKREASPTDVDEGGFTLLSVSVYLDNIR